MQCGGYSGMRNNAALILVLYVLLVIILIGAF